MYDSKSCMGYLERMRLIPTLRRPKSRVQPRELGVHQVPLQPPLPLPEFVRSDTGQTGPWPEGRQNES